MEFKRSLYAIMFMIVFVNMCSARVAVLDKSSSLTEQLLQETNKLGFKIDQSQIKTVYSNVKGSNDVIVAAPLSKAIDTTSDQIKNGEVYVGIQCISSKQLNGCFKVRLAGADDNGIKLELVDDDGKVLASKSVSSSDQPVKRAVSGSLSADNAAAPAAAAQARHLWCVWINGRFIGCFDIVIIIFDNAILFFVK